jgi:hypothetical protein
VALNTPAVEVQGPLHHARGHGTRGTIPYGNWPRAQIS